MFDYKQSLSEFMMEMSDRKSKWKELLHIICKEADTGRYELLTKDPEMFIFDKRLTREGFSVSFDYDECGKTEHMLVRWFYPKKNTDECSKEYFFNNIEPNNFMGVYGKIRSKPILEEIRNEITFRIEKIPERMKVVSVYLNGRELSQFRISRPLETPDEVLYDEIAIIFSELLK